MSVCGTAPVFAKACGVSRPGTRTTISCPGLKPSARSYSAGSMCDPARFAGIDAAASATRRPVTVEGSATVNQSFGNGSRHWAAGEVPPGGAVGTASRKSQRSALVRSTCAGGVQAGDPVSVLCVVTTRCSTCRWRWLPLPVQTETATFARTTTVSGPQRAASSRPLRDRSSVTLRVPGPRKRSPRLAPRRSPSRRASRRAVSAVSAVRRTWSSPVASSACRVAGAVICRSRGCAWATAPGAAAVATTATAATARPILRIRPCTCRSLVDR